MLNTTEFSVAQMFNDELYVFGGRTSGIMVPDPGQMRLVLINGETAAGVTGDAWSYSLAWTQVSSQADPGTPPPMERAAIAVCGDSGAMSVLPGQLGSGSATEPVWRLRRGGWQAHSQITDDPR